MNTKQLMQDLIKAAYAQAEMPASQKTALDGIFGIGVTSGVVVTLNAWSKDHGEQQAELSALRTAAIADAAEIERLDQCIGELRLELSKCQERNDELCIASHNQTVKISKIRKVINEN